MANLKLERGKLRVHHINNVARVLQVLDEKFQIKLINISTNDIVDGNRKITLGLIWRIILHWQVNNILLNTSNLGPFTAFQTLVVDQPSSQQQQSPRKISNLKDHQHPNRSQLPQQQQQFPKHRTNIPFVATVIGSNNNNNNRFTTNESPISSRKTSTTNPTTIFQRAGTLLTKSAATMQHSPESQQSVVKKKPDSDVSRSHQNEPKPKPLSQNDLEKALLAWCRQSTENYEGVQIVNFTTSWNDGLAFNALIHHFRPKLFSYGEILSLKPSERFEHAFEMAYKHFKIEKLLDPEDVYTTKPDKKSVMMYLMCFFQVLQNENKQTEPIKQSESFEKLFSAFKASKQSSTDSSCVDSSQPVGRKQSRIPVIKQVRANEMTSGVPDVIPTMPASSQTSTSNIGSCCREVTAIDPKLLNEFQIEIEEKLMWLVEIQDILQERQTLDQKRFLQAKFDLKINDDQDFPGQQSFESSESILDSDVSSSAEAKSEPARKIRDQILVTIEAAEYSKTRFAEHEQLMTELTMFSEKILELLNKGKDYYERFRQQGQSSAGNEAAKHELVMHMNLLNGKFETLRLKATKHQQFLQNMLKQAQYKQLTGLKLLMVQTEQRISIMIPEKHDVIPFSLASVQEQLQQFQELQKSMLEEQEILNKVSNFVIIEQEDQQDGARYLSDNLEALNERWLNICKIIENRGTFLKKLFTTWDAFEQEKQRLLKWIGGLEHRLARIDSIFEQIKDEPQFDRSNFELLKKMANRLERMRDEAVFGPRPISPSPTNDDKDGDNDRKPVTAKYIELTYALVALDSKGDSKLSQKTKQANRDFGQRWELLCGNIEHIENGVKKLLKQFPEQFHREYEQQTKSETITESESSVVSIVSECVETLETEEEHETETNEDVDEDRQTKSTSSLKIESIFDPKKLDALRVWMDDLEAKIYSLEASKPLETISDSQTEIIAEMPETIEDCLRILTELKQCSILESFETRTKGSVEPRFDLEYEDKICGEIVEDFLKNLPYCQEIVKHTETYFNSLDQESRSGEHKEIIELVKRFDAVLAIIEETRERIVAAYNLFSINKKTILSSKMLDEYFREFEQIYKSTSNNSTRPIDEASKEAMMAKIQNCFEYIDSNHKYEDLYQLKLKFPQLLNVWPERISQDDESPFVWRRHIIREAVNHDSLFQACCLDWSERMWTFEKRLAWLGRLASLLKTRLAAPKDGNPDRKTSNTSNNKADKVMMIIDKFESVLTHMLQCLNEFEGDDDEDEDEDEDDDEQLGTMDMNKQHSKDSGVVVEDNRKKFKAKPSNSSPSVDQHPGSKLCSFSDLANAIDKRNYILHYLQETMEGEEKEYHFACKCAAECIFNKSQIDGKESAEIEKLLKNVDAKDYDEHTGKMIKSIQSTIDKWNRMVDVFREIIPKLAAISPSITVLETEFSQLSKFIESSDNFLDEPVAIGDSESLQCQLTECLRLKNYMEGTAEEIFQKIMDVTQNALKLLLGDEVFWNVVPVMKCTKEIWNSLCERILGKLERLKQAQKLTLEFIEKLDNYKQKLNEIEQLVQEPLAMDKLLKSGPPSKSSKIPILNVADMALYNVPKFLLDKINKIHLNYCKEVTGRKDGIIAQIEQFTSSMTKSNTLAFELLKEGAQNDLPARFSDLKKILTNGSELFEMSLQTFSAVEELRTAELIHHKKLQHYETLVNGQQNIEDLENAVQVLDQIEEGISYLHDIHKPDGLQSLEQMWMDKPFISYLKTALPTVASIFDKYRNEWLEMIYYRAGLSENLTQTMDVLQKFKADCQEADLLIRSMKTWILEFRDRLISDPKSFDQNEWLSLETKRKEMITMENLHSSKFRVLGFDCAAERLENKAKIVQKMFDELIVIKEQQRKEWISNNDSVKMVQTIDEFQSNKVEDETLDVDKRISMAEKNLADLGALINEMEIALGDCDSDIPSLLKQKIDLNCSGYQAQLSILAQEIDRLKQSIPATSINNEEQTAETMTTNHLERLNNLDRTRQALEESLGLRIEILNYLLQLCNDINHHLLKLEKEANQAKIDLNELAKEDQDYHVQQIKQTCRMILADICYLKEKLDISCITHSDILIGIEEIGSCYDDVITFVAEHYLLDSDGDDDDVEEEEEEEEEEDAGYFDFSNELNDTVIKVPPEVLDPLTPRQDTSHSSSELKQTSPQVHEPLDSKVDKTTVVQQLSSQQQLLAASLKNEMIVASGMQPKSPLPPRPSPPKLSKPETSVPKEKEPQTVTMTESNSRNIADNDGKQEEKLKEAIKRRKIEALLLNKQSLEPKDSYSFQTYLIMLKLLEIDIDRIGERKIPELQQRQHNQANNMFLFMLEAELFFLNKSLNEVRIRLEQIICASVICGLRPSKPISMVSTINICLKHRLMQIDQPESYDQVKICDLFTTRWNFDSLVAIDWRKDTDRQKDWDRITCQVLRQFNRLEKKFNHSNGIFLTLHRHLRLIHENTIQFNLEIRRLFDWFENVELQINNGRVTLVSADPNRLEETDLNLHVVARTQSLLVTQLKTHVPVYARLDVIYRKILHHFSPEINEKFRHYSFDFQALLEAKNRIKIEMNKVKRKWNSIVHELTWRRQCLIDLATFKPGATVNTRPYRAGQDKDFDRLISNSVKNEFIDTNRSIQEYKESFIVDQLKSWIDNTNHELDRIIDKIVLSDNDLELSINLHSKLKNMEQDMAKQFMNWMLLTQEPFVRLLHVAQLSQDDQTALNDQFQSVSVRLYNLAYFVDEFITTCSNIERLIQNELEWLLTAHEHLQLIDDYLGKSSPLFKRDWAIILEEVSTNKTIPATESLPLESLAFMENIRNTLIHHERTIKQISVLFEELRQDSGNVSLKYQTNKLSEKFDQIKKLYHYLVEQLRRHGLTIWSSIHYLFKYVLGYFHQYRRQKKKLQQTTLMKNNSNSKGSRSNNNNNSLKSIDSERSSRHHHGSTQMWEYNHNVLKQYYDMATIELQRWIEFETFILSLFIEKSLVEPSEYRQNSTKTINDLAAEDSSDLEKSTPSSSNSQQQSYIVQPSNLLKFTIRRCEDFLTELEFSVTILKQLWLQLSSDYENDDTPFYDDCRIDNLSKKFGDAAANEINKSEQNVKPTTENLFKKSVVKKPTTVLLNRTQSITTNCARKDDDESNNRKTIDKNTISNNQNNDDDDQSLNLKRFHSLGPARRTRPITAALKISHLATPTRSDKKNIVADVHSSSNNDDDDNQTITVTVAAPVSSQSSFTPPKTPNLVNTILDQQTFGWKVSAPDYKYYQSIQNEIMERMRDIQREHHQRSLQNLIQNIKQRQQQKINDNLYDTVADVITSSTMPDGSNNLDAYYNRPPDLPEMNNSNNLDMQRNDIEKWLDSMEQRLSQITIQQFAQNPPSTTTNSNNQSPSQIRKQDLFNDDILGQQELKNQLDTLMDYENECNQYGSRLQILSNSIDARIASLKPPAPPPTAGSKPTTMANGGASVDTNNIISMPYYDHLIKLRKQASDMQCRSNYLFLCIKCKTRSLNELISITASSQNRNIMSMINGSASGTDLDFYGSHSSTSSPSIKKSSKQHTASSSSSPPPPLPPPSSSSSSSSQMMMMMKPGSISKHDAHDTGTNIISSSTGGGGSPYNSSISTEQKNSTNNIVVTSSALGGSNSSNYSLHEQSEKRFLKWLTEMEQSLDFIEKGLAAESALINNDGSITNFNNDDGALYSNVSEMQQMHMNYYEKIKIIQREIEQKRADHRLLMELIDNGQDSSTSDTIYKRSTLEQQQGTVSPTTTNSHHKNSSAKNTDPWFQRFRQRVDQLNGRWNSVRLRVLTLRSRLESSSLIHKNNTTTCPATHSTSMYSMNSYNMPKEELNPMLSMVAFNSVVSERHSQLMLSLRELTEWIIKKQMDYEQIPQQPADTQHAQPMPMDVVSVMNQKSSLIMLRNQLIEKRPIIDSSLLACHNFLRRLSVKRAQDVKLNAAKLSSSASIAFSVASSSTVIGQNNNEQQQKQHQKQQSDLENIELTLNREMNKLLELWHSIQSTVDLGLKRLDEAHLRLTDLQRVMDDLCAKLHEAEMVKSEWTPLDQIQFDELPRHRSQLKMFQQTYVAPVSRDVIHVNQIAARLTGRNVPLSHANLKSLEEVTMRARLLRMAVDERSKELDQVVHDHNTAQQHFLTEAVDEPWERAVTNNKLPCYINHKTETVHTLSPRYQEIMKSMNQFNDVRYAVYRTAMKLRYLQQQLGLDQVSLENLTEAFQQHGFGPNFSAPSLMSVDPNDDSRKSSQTNNTIKSPTMNPINRLNGDDINNEELPYELRLISVQDLVSCLKMIFETAESERVQFENKSVNSATSATSGSSSSHSKSSSNNKNGKPKTGSIKRSSSSSTGDQQSSKNQPLKNEDSLSTSGINVPLYVDLCLNWLLDLYDASSRTGFIRQFSFQVAIVLLSRISLEQKYIYLFSLISNDNQTTDERRFGLLIYDCLRLPKLLGEVAAFGGTNVEPSVRSCLEMAGNPKDGLTLDHVLNWIRAEPQSLVWVVVIHRLRLAERSRHPAKCNSCKCFPIVGFRYRCLKCFNFDLCQKCFLMDKIVKKHKPSHPMQEYCLATTTGEDLKDFGKILRNKFKSGRYFKRHQELGYLPVQSLHEGDRIEESAPSFVHTLQGSYSHAPSSNTTPVHTLSFPPRAASPSSMTQRDMDFVLDLQHMPAQQPQQSIPYDSGIYGTRPINTGISKFQTNVEHHLPKTNPPSTSMQRREAAEIMTTDSVSHFNQARRKSTDDVHQRLGQYAQRLAEAEMTWQQQQQQQQQQQKMMLTPRSESSRGSISNSSSRSHRGTTKFDSSTPSGAVQQSPSIVDYQHHVYGVRPFNHQHPPAPPPSSSSYRLRGGEEINNVTYDIIQNPTEILSKLAVDQRNELEIIIKRLKEENRILMTEYAQLKIDEKPKTGNSLEDGVSQSALDQKKIDRNLAQKPNEQKSDVYSAKQNPNNINDKATNNQNIGLSLQSSDHTNNVAAIIQPVDGQNIGDDKFTITENNDDVSIHKNNRKIPAYLLEEAKRLTQDKQQLESRTNELEKCNQLLESQLEAFLYYINNTGSLDQASKQSFESRINKTKKLLEREQKIKASYGEVATANNISSVEQRNASVRASILKFDNDSNENVNNITNDNGQIVQSTTINDNGDDDFAKRDAWFSSRSSRGASSNSTKAQRTEMESKKQYHQPLLHTAAHRIDTAVGSLVDAFNIQDSSETSDTDGCDSGKANAGCRKQQQSMTGNNGKQPIAQQQPTQKPNP